MTASKPTLNGGFRNSTKMLGRHDESESLCLLEIVTAFDLGTLCTLDLVVSTGRGRGARWKLL